MSLGKRLNRAVAPWVLRAVVYALSAFYSALFLLSLLRRFLSDPRRPLFAVKPRPLPPAPLDAGRLHSYVRLKNVKLHYVEAGQRENPLMLFLHGFPEFWYSWRHQLDEFSKNYWTVAVDMRGYGDSEKPPGIKYYKMNYLVEDVKNLIDALGKENCILVAHDWGGYVAWYFLALYPSYVSSYVVMNAPHPLIFKKKIITSFKQFRKSWYIFFFQMPILPELSMFLKDMGGLKRIFKSNKSPDPITEEDVEAYKFMFGRPGGFTYPINYYRANLIPDTKLLKKKKDNQKLPPGLFIFGDQDLAIESSIVDETCKIVPNLTAEIIPGASHFVQQDDPVRVNQAIREFLKSGYESEIKIVSTD